MYLNEHLKKDSQYETLEDIFLWSWDNTAYF